MSDAFKDTIESALLGKVTEIETNLITLGQKIETKIDDNNKFIDELEAQIEKFKQQIADLESSKEMSELSQKETKEIEAKIKEIQTKINGLNELVDQIQPTKNDNSSFFSSLVGPNLSRASTLSSEEVSVGGKNKKSHKSHKNKKSHKLHKSHKSHKLHKSKKIVKRTNKYKKKSKKNGMFKGILSSLNQNYTIA